MVVGTSDFRRLQQAVGEVAADLVNSSTQKAERIHRHEPKVDKMMLELVDRKVGADGDAKQMDHVQHQNCGYQKAQDKQRLVERVAEADAIVVAIGNEVLDRWQMGLRRKTVSLQVQAGEPTVDQQLRLSPWSCRCSTAFEQSAAANQACIDAVAGASPRL